LRATRPYARLARALLVLAAAASGLGLGPTAPPAQALPVQEEPTLPHAGGVAADVDVFKADDGDVVGALDNLHGNLRTELRDLESARSHLASAQDRKAKADQAVAATQKHIDDLTAQSDGVVVDAAASTATRPSRSPYVDPTAARPTTPSTRHRRRPAPRPRPGPARRCTSGLAIDITCGGGTIGRGSACFGWLASHAAGYGLHNLPSEPWHWSTDGS
jgi:hypothetical protein